MLLEGAREPRIEEAYANGKKDIGGAATPWGQRLGANTKAW